MAPTPLNADERAAIIETCTKMTYFIDERRWEDLHQIFTETIELDYSAIFGGAPTTTPRADYIQNAQFLLGNLDSTQHLVSGHLVSGDGKTAECVSQVVATHFKPNNAGEALWTSGGQYHMTLHKTGDDGWRIQSVRAIQRWCTGNREVMRLGRMPR